MPTLSDFHMLSPVRCFIAVSELPAISVGILSFPFVVVTLINVPFFTVALELCQKRS